MNHFDKKNIELSQTKCVLSKIGMMDITSKNTKTTY